MLACGQPSDAYTLVSAGIAGVICRRDQMPYLDMGSETRACLQAGSEQSAHGGPVACPSHPPVPEQARASVAGPGSRWRPM